MEDIVSLVRREYVDKKGGSVFFNRLDSNPNDLTSDDLEQVIAIKCFPKPGGPSRDFVKLKGDLTGCAQILEIAIHLYPSAVQSSTTDPEDVLAVFLVTSIESMKTTCDLPWPKGSVGMPKQAEGDLKYLSSQAAQLARVSSSLQGGPAAPQTAAYIKTLSDIRLRLGQLVTDLH